MMENVKEHEEQGNKRVVPFMRFGSVYAPLEPLTRHEEVLVAYSERARTRSALVGLLIGWSLGFVTGAAAVALVKTGLRIWG